MNMITSKVLKTVWIWAPPIILMSIIFFLSTKQNLNVSEQDWIDFIVFKSLHMVEYAVLYFLFLRAYYLSFTKQWSWKRVTITAMISAIAYGALDEIHQTFVPTRTGTIRDIGIDFIGIFIAFLYTKWYRTQIRSILI